ALAHDHLRAKPEIARPALRLTMDDLAARVIQKLDDVDQAHYASPFILMGKNASLTRGPENAPAAAGYLTILCVAVFALCAKTATQKGITALRKMKCRAARYH